LLIVRVSTQEAEMTGLTQVAKGRAKVRIVAEVVVCLEGRD
jgi:hypothetical protein